MSLLYTLKALDCARYEPLVGLVFPSVNLKAFYEDAGFQVYDCSGLPVFRHTTACWGRFSSPIALRAFLLGLRGWLNRKRRLASLIEKIRPDLIHLNSSILAPLAQDLMETRFPFVWHVRESPVSGYFGFRYRWMRRLLQSAEDRVIFISNADRRAWVGDSNGSVVRNFVDFKAFDAEHESSDIEDAKNQLSEHPERATVLYLGGFADIKGIFPLLRALSKLRDLGLAVNCICPGMLQSPIDSLSRGWIRKIATRLGFLSCSERSEQMIRDFGIESCLVRLPFSKEIPQLLRLSDCLVFPSIEPHFARPVIEAQVLGIPVVASKIDGVSELVENSGSGLLVEPADAEALVEGIRLALAEKEKNPESFEITRRYARREYDGQLQILKIQAIYDSILEIK